MDTIKKWWTSLSLNKTDYTRRSGLVAYPSDEAMAVLAMMKPLSGNRDFIFPRRIKPNQPINSQTVNASLKRAGFGGVLVSYRLRSITSTALNEQGFPPDVIEAALAHVDKNEIRRAYNRSDYHEQRRPMMQ